MRINLLHNKIVMDTVSNKFIESFTANLVPSLEARFSTLESVTLYEDYLSDGFLSDGVFCCPFTVVDSLGAHRVFVSWRVDKRNFENCIPYSYKGQAPLSFEIVDDVDERIKSCVSSRALLPNENSIQLKIDAASADKTFLSGKYSQSFVDLMASKITEAIESEFEISATNESTLMLQLSFEPGTFMEHSFESSTYRRIQICARACSMRDLWIKWTRLDKESSYTVGDHVKDGDIVFEICDDVPEKIREKEYRYLMARSPDAYRTAMSRKNLTEWRELVKRVIKRGECKAAEVIPSSSAIKVEELEIKPELPEKPEFFVPKEAPVIDIPKESEELAEPEVNSFESIDLKALLDSYGEDNENEEEEEEINPDLKELLFSVINRQNAEEAETVLNNSEAEESDSSDEEDLDAPPFDIDEEPDPLAILNALVNESEPLEEEPEEIFEEIPEDVAEDETEEETEEEQKTEPVSEISEEIGVSESFAESYRLEILELCREKDGLISMIDEKNAVILEKESEIKELKARLLRNDEERNELNSEIENLRKELAAKRREEEREKDRIASAARLAVESQSNTEFEDEDAADQESALEKERLEAERLEAERLARQREAEEKAEAERLIREEEARRKAEEEKKAAESAAPQSSVRYVSKTADMFFRYPVDPNVTRRIQDIIVSTVKYFEKENIYMKVKATIPDAKTVRLEFLEIPEDELALLTDIIRVLGHSKLGITRVLLD